MSRLAIVILSLGVCACVDGPPNGDDDADGPPPVARLVASWDPSACSDPHRVVIELDEITTGAPQASGSATCDLGGVSIDAPHLGAYRARVYAAGIADADARVTDLDIEQPIVKWAIGDPP